MKQPKLGSGKRFKKLRDIIARKGNVQDPNAVAAAVGIKKFGQEKMTELAQHGKKAKK
jgi:hypothetical protein